MYLFQCGTDTGIGCTLLGPSETRDCWSERLHCPASPQCLPASLTLQMCPVAQRCFGQSGQPGFCPTPPFCSDSSRPGHGPPWAGQQPLLTPAIKLKSYSPILRLWSVQSIAPWPLMQLWPQHMFGAPRIKQTSLRPRSTACWFTCVRCRGPRMAAMHTHHAVPTSEGGPWAGKEEGRKDWPLLTPSCVHHSSIQTNPTPIPPIPLYKLHISCFIRQKSAYWLQEALGSESKINENLIAWASYTD